MGALEGSGVGLPAAKVGDSDGDAEGAHEVSTVGRTVGLPGRYVGADDGAAVGETVGDDDGEGVGDPTSNVGDIVG